MSPILGLCSLLASLLLSSLGKPLFGMVLEATIKGTHPSWRNTHLHMFVIMGPDQQIDITTFEVVPTRNIRSTLGTNLAPWSGPFSRLF